MKKQIVNTVLFLITSDLNVKFAILYVKIADIEQQKHSALCSQVARTSKGGSHYQNTQNKRDDN